MDAAVDAWRLSGGTIGKKMQCLAFMKGLYMKSLPDITDLDFETNTHDPQSMLCGEFGQPGLRRSAR